MYPTEKRISNKIQQHFERKIVVIESKHSKTKAAISTSETKFIWMCEETEVKLLLSQSRNKGYAGFLVAILKFPIASSDIIYLRLLTEALSWPQPA